MYVGVHIVKSMRFDIKKVDFSLKEKRLKKKKKEKKTLAFPE